MMKSALLGMAFAVALAVPGFAATMTFNGVNDDPIADTYFENGMTAVGNGMLGIFGTGVAHFDDSGTSAPSSIAFSMASAFNAIGFDLQPIAFDYAVCNSLTDICESRSYQNVLVQGFSGANLIATLLFDMGSDPLAVHLSAAFSNLTALRISVLSPSAPPIGYYHECGSPCSHFEVDNVALAPVPLPAIFPVAAAMLASSTAFTFRRKKLKARA